MRVAEIRVHFNGPTEELMKDKEVAAKISLGRDRIDGIARSLAAIGALKISVEERRALRAKILEARKAQSRP